MISIKSLPLKGVPNKPIKAGTKVKNICLIDGEHNNDCKIDGFGDMALNPSLLEKNHWRQKKQNAVTNKCEF